MIHYRYYADAPEEDIEQLVQTARLARLVTAGPPGEAPRVGLYPFTSGEKLFEIHLHRADEQIADLRERSVCTFEIDEVLSTIPSHWIDPENAVFATAYHRTVAYECVATLVEDVSAIAGQQARIMARYQPEGGHRRLTADDPIYSELLAMLVGVRLEVRRRKVKFKLGQNRPFEVRAKLVDHLRARGGELDGRTAEALERTIALRWTTQGRPT